MQSHDVLLRHAARSAGYQFAHTTLAALGSINVLIMPEPWDCFIADRKMQLASSKRIGEVMTLSRWSSAGPSAWGLLNHLHLDANLLSGTLPDTWGSKGSFASITNITLASNNLRGSIPASWGTDANGKSAFRKLPVVTLRPGALPHALVTILAWWPLHVL